MIIADSSVWIDFLRNVPTRQVAMLAEQIEIGTVIMADLVLCEVLQGSRDEAQFQQRLREFAQLETIAVAGEEIAVETAANYRFLRAKGVTIRKTIDALIATRCIREDIPLLYSDRDFDPFVAHLGLRSALNIGLN